MTGLEVALAHHKEGRLIEAEAGYRSFLRTHPNDPSALNLFGVVQSQLGHHDRAIEYLRRAAAACPAEPTVILNLAMAYREAGRLDEAKESFREAIRLKPDCAEAHNNLGSLLQIAGDLPAAVAHFREAVRLDPDFRTAHDNLAKCLSHMDRPKEALAHFLEVLRLDPHSPDAHFETGTIYQRISKLPEARRHYEEALRLRPGDADATANLGLVLQSEGKVDEAAAWFREAVALRPATSFAYYYLGEMAKAGRYQLSDDDLAAMEVAAAAEGISAREASMLSFALATELDRRKRYDEAFRHYRRANELKREYAAEWGLVFSPSKHEDAVERLIEFFTPQRVRELATSGITTEVPVFVVGMPRSGTSLIEQILASHPQVFGAGELMEIPEITDSLSGEQGRAARYPACVAEAGPGVLRRHAEAYVRVLTEMGDDAARVIDKLPGNFLHLGLIAILFPRARVIHCRRDPRDSCLSCFQQNFRNLVFTSSLEFLGRYYRAYERLMEHWRKVIPLRMYEIEYEVLVDGLEEKSREMVEFCGLAWDDRCLTFYRTERIVHTASELQVRQPVYRSSIGRWKRYEAHLGPLFDALAGKEGAGARTGGPGAWK